MGDYSKSTCESDISGLVDALERAKYGVNKNVGQMDFENCDAKDEMVEIASEMIQICDALITEISSYTFE